MWGGYFLILSDLGTKFKNKIVREVCNLLAIYKKRSSGYRPQTSGVIRVWHRVLHSMMAKVISTDQRDWRKYLGYVNFCYNATVHSVTRFFPFFL